MSPFVLYTRLRARCGVLPVTDRSLTRGVIA